MVTTLTPPRNLRELAIYFLLLAILGFLLVLTLTLFQFSLPTFEPVSLGVVSQYTLNQPVYRVINTRNSAVYAWVVNLDGELHVFDARATHSWSRSQNCKIVWITDASGSSPKDFFADPCVGGSWDIGGNHLWGPSPRSLDWFPAEVRNGELWIDTYPQFGASWRD